MISSNKWKTGQETDDVVINREISTEILKVKNLIVRKETLAAQTRQLQLRIVSANVPVPDSTEFT